MISFPDIVCPRQDWDEREEIDDPEDKKPEGYDDIPKQIVDPDATKPDDWDDDSDGAALPSHFPLSFSSLLHTVGLVCVCLTSRAYTSKTRDAFAGWLPRFLSRR